MNDLSLFTAGDGHRIAWRIDGNGDNPIVVLSNSIATSLHMWDGQVEELSKYFRVLRYDLRGHGASSVPPGAYSLDRLGRDVIELTDSLGIERFHFLGLSLGGFIGQWLGIRAPERVDRLILANTSPYLGPPRQFDEWIAAVLQAPDMTQATDGFLRNWFPAHMIEANLGTIDRFRAMLLEINPHGLAGAYAAVRDTDLRRTIALITRPTLVIAGRDDTVTLASHSEEIAATIPGAKLLILPAVHLSNVECPEEFVRAVLGFLREA